MYACLCPCAPSTARRISSPCTPPRHALRLMSSSASRWGWGCRAGAHVSAGRRSAVSARRPSPGSRALLPYQLTAAQERTIAEIRHDMASGTAMNRMLVGDVGCGKTVCAAAAVYVAVRSGRQAAIMAPTGIPAAQHAAELIPLFARIGIRGELLTGATTAARKRKIRASLADPDPAARLDLSSARRHCCPPAWILPRPRWS